MQFSHAFIALVAAGFASAQLPDVPSCSLQCFTEALTSDGCSELTDFECHCGKPALVKEIQPCVEKACELEDQSSVSDAVVSVCSDAGVPIEVPSPGGDDGDDDDGDDGGDKPTATEAPTEPTEEPEPTDEPEEPEEPSEEPSEPAYPTEEPAPPSSSATPTPSSSLPPGETPSPSAPVFTGAASKNNIGGAAALAMAAAYYL